MLKKCFLLTSVLFCIKETFAQNSLNYFYNLSYKNPAFFSNQKVQIDINSCSFYNALPLGIYGHGINILGQNKKNIGGSLKIQRYSLGKNQNQTESSFCANYFSLLNFKKQITFGLGIKNIQSTINDDLLTTNLALDDLVYSYGKESSKSNSFLIPLGIDISNEGFNVGAYYAKGIQIESQYGVYAKLLTYTSNIKEYKALNYTGLSVSKEFINSQIAITNTLEIDNYKIDIFGHYNLKGGLKNFMTIGLGVHYHWKIFDLNVQSAYNNQRLGTSNQLGLQIYF